MNNSIELLIFNMIYGCIMLLLGIFLKKTKHSSTVIMFISGDYSDLVLGPGDLGHFGPGKKEASCTCVGRK